MHFGRAILVFLLALSVAVLPSMAGAASATKSAGMLNMSSSMDDMDCCPHGKVPSEKAIDGCCSSMASCPMNCFGTTAAASLIIFPSLLGDLAFSFANNSLHSHTGSPPFRPPRI
jgi:hypothetical protein